MCIYMITHTSALSIYRHRAPHSVGLCGVMNMEGLLASYISANDQKTDVTLQAELPNFLITEVHYMLKITMTFC